jgi:microcin C transport system permease protein
VASFILTYGISIFLGLFMAYHAHKFADSSLSLGLIVASAIPPFAFGVLLLVFFAGGTFFDLFPLGYLHSEEYFDLSLGGKILDRLHHFALPLAAYMIGSFTTLAFLCRNSVLDAINKDYIRTARAIGVSRWKLYTRHAFRNALIPIVTGIGGFLAVFLSGSLLVETIFQLNGIGLLGFQALMSRDYNMIMGLTFLQSVALLVGNLIGDLAYMAVDPRVDFAGS